MVIQQYNNPLHNLTLQKIVEELVDHYGSDKTRAESEYQLL